MKMKTIAFTVVAALAFAAAADQPKQLTEQEKFTTALSEYNTKGNIGSIRQFIECAFGKDNSPIATNAEFIAWMDDLMSKSTIAVPPMFNFGRFNDVFPKTSTRSISAFGQAYPTFIDAVSRGQLPDAKSKNYIKYVFESLAFRKSVSRDLYPQHALNGVINSFKDSSIYIVRRWLRSQDKSFVSKPVVENYIEVTNGVEVAKTRTVLVNPAKPYIERLNACLNAPKLAGLKEWLVSMGVAEEDMPDFTLLNTIIQITDEEFIDTKKKVLDGEMAFDIAWQIKFRYYLGTEEYNKFVKLYNEDAE